MVAESILPGLRERDWFEVGGIFFLIEQSYRPAESCLETRYTFVQGQQTERRTGYHWVYTLGEIRRMLEEAELNPNQLYSSLAGEPYELGSPYLLLVAERG